MPKKLDAFIDREAEEGSSDDEPDAKRQKYEDKETAVPKEVAELQAEIDAREKAENGNTGARRLYGDFLSKWEDQEKVEEQRRKYTSRD